MNAYKTYFDRQTLSPAAHDRLMALGKAPAKKKSFSLQKWGALAACAALILGVWAYLDPPPDLEPKGTMEVLLPDLTSEPGKTDPVDPLQPPEDNGILIHSPTTEDQTAFYCMPALNFQEGMGEVAACLALPEGSFYVELTLEDLQKIFWGPEGKPDTLNPDTNLPWVLGWDGYTVQIGARYDGNGDLWMLSVYGTKGLDTLELEISPGRLPPQCLADPGGESVDVNGTEVTSYYHAYDRDGDGLTDHVCTSEFLVDGYGYRFRNVYTETGEEEYDVAEAAKFQNVCFVIRAAQWTDSRCYFGHIAHTDNIPAWEEIPFDTLSAAREKADFAPYLPQAVPGGMESFEGWLTYQEGWCNTVHAAWYAAGSGAYANLAVYLPERAEEHAVVDVNVPESYDVRLYEGAWYDQVPEAYRDEFHQPTFRAEDMSLAVVEARWRTWEEKGSSGMLCNFKILHDNGVLVAWESEGLTAQEVWALIEPTL